MTKLKQKNTGKPKMWQNTKTQIVTKLKKNLNCDKTENLNFDKTQTLKSWQNSTTLILTKLKTTNCGKTNKNFKLWQNSKIIWWHNSNNPIVTQLKKSYCDKTKKNQILTVYLVTVTLVAVGKISSNLYRASVCDMEKGTFLLISLSQILYYTL